MHLPVRRSDQRSDEAFVFLPVGFVVDVERKGCGAHHRRHEPLQQSVAGEAVQFGQPVWLDAA